MIKRNMKTLLIGLVVFLLFAGVAVVGFFLVPMALIHPKIVRMTPEDGDGRISPRTAIHIEFNQHVQLDSVKKELSFDPPVSFTVKQNGKEIIVQPEGELAYDTVYRMDLGHGVKNFFGNTLEEPVKITFSTASYVSVSTVTPDDGTTNVALTAPIMIRFHQPIVSDEAIAAAAQDPEKAKALPQPLTVEGAGVGIIPGFGHWISPVLYRFAPDHQWPSAKQYTATLRADITADGFAHLEQPKVWNFSTAAPLLVSTYPRDGAVEILPTDSVQVHLASDVDINSASDLFTIEEVEHGTTVSGQKVSTGETLLFQPTPPLQQGMQYKATLLPGIRTKSGEMINSDAHSWQFTTMGHLEVVQVEPPADTQDVLVNTHRISVRFNHPVEVAGPIGARASQQSPLTINPPLSGKGYWLNSSTYVFSPTEQLAPLTTYQVDIAQDLHDQYGASLSAPYTWKFTTILPKVTRIIPSDQEQFAHPNKPIQVTFNQPMDPVRLMGAITLKRNDNSQVVRGSVAVVAEDSVTFTPAEPLERGTTYILSIARQAQAARSNATLAKETTAIFRVAPNPQLTETQPVRGDPTADPSSGLELSFSAPMDWTSVLKHLTIEPAISDYYTYTEETKLFVNLSLEPDSDYQITIGREAQDVYGVSLGQDQILRFHTRSLDPSLSLIGAYQIGTYNARNPLHVPLRHVNVNEISYHIYQLDPIQAARLVADYQAWESFAPDQSAHVTTGKVALQAPPNREAIDILQLGQFDAGIYYLKIEGLAKRGTPDVTSIADRQIMVISPYSLTIKRSADRLFLWVIDLSTGEPVADVPFTVAYGLSREQESDPFDLQQRELGKSNSEGIVHEPFTEANMYTPLFVWSPVGKHFVFATTNWNEGINPWDFGLSANYEQIPLVGNVYTDRPIYRPNQTVFIRGAVRKNEQEKYILPESKQTVNLVVHDPKNNTIFSTIVNLSEFGTFNSSMALDKAAIPGTYAISILDNSSQNVEQPFIYGSFTVAEYRKPAFEVTVTPDEPDVVQDEPLQMDIVARSFSGAMVANAPVRWRLLSEPLFFSSSAAPLFSFEDPDDASAWYRQERTTVGGKLVAEGTATTDAQGFLTVQVPTTLEKYSQSRKLTLDVEVTDIDGQVIASQGRSNVHAGAFSIGVRPEGYVVEQGQPQKISLVTLDMYEQPVGERNITIEIYRREWFSVREQGADGQTYWTSSFSDTLVETQSAQTDSQGRGAISFIPHEGGSYHIRATGQDDKGHTIRSGAFTWVYGNDVFWGINDSNRIDLIADKNRYAPGDTAHVLVAAPYKGMKALMTIERTGIIEHRIMTLQDTTEMLDIPITADYAPDVYVSLVLIKPADDTAPDVRVGLVNLHVSSEQQQLTITVTPNTQKPSPRQEVTYTIKATDYTGKGVQAECSLALVDKAVLMLADDPNPSFTQAFYENRPLGVFTAQTITALVDRTTQLLKRDAKGGAGGMSSDIYVRRDFADTAYWNPTLVTNDQGIAQVTVRLPDNVTTWRMTVRGISSNTLVGEQTSDIVATQPLLVRPSLPRFLTVGDEPTVQAVVQNTTSQPLDGTIQLDVSGLDVQTPTQQSVHIPAVGQTVVRWNGKVASAEQATFRFAIESGQFKDVIEQVVPIQRFVTPEVAATAGQVFDTPIMEKIALPASSSDTASLDLGQIDLELTPSLAAGVESGLTYLEHFPYACTEQTVSRFLPNAVIYRIFQQMGIDDPKLKSGLEHNLTQGLQRLYALQQLDGGWGWWSADKSNTYLTAYVVQGLLEARKSGYGIERHVLDDGLKFLTTALNQTDTTPISDELRAYLLFVLSEAGQTDHGRLIALYDRYATLPISAQAYLLMTFKQMGGEDERVQSLVGNLISTSILHTTDAHWEEAATDPWTMGSDGRTTALALQALVRADPQHMLIPNAVRFLMNVREQGHWSSTHETATVLMALAEYLAQSGELDADYRYRALLENTTLSEGKVDKNNLANPIQVQIALSDVLKQPIDGTSTASFGLEKQGKGRLFYVLRMRYQREAESVQPLDEGIHIQREYRAVDPVTLLPTEERVSEAQAGDVVQVRLTIRTAENVQYLTVEDMLPAGLEALDTNLKSVTSVAEDANLEKAQTAYPDWWYFTQTEIHDNRVALFATDLSAGTYFYSYLARAVIPGTYQTLPATAYQMYAPEVFGRSAGAKFTVREP